MPISVSNQAYIFLWAVLGGAIIAFLYDVLRIKRKAIKTISIFIYIEDLLYWIAVALVMFSVVYYSNDGEIRGYVFIGTLLGVILYMLMLSKLVINSSMFVIRTIYRIVKFIWNIVSYPFKVLLRILSVPLGFLARFAGKLFKKARRAGKNKISKAAMWTKILKNIRKKI